MSRLQISLIFVGALLLAGCGSGESGSIAITRPPSDQPTLDTTRTLLLDPTLASASTTGTSPPSNGCASAISWSDAIDHVGEQATVRGFVKGANYATRTKGKPTFLDLGKPYPDPSRFTVVIWGADRARFTVAPEKAFNGKTICVTGLITSYKGGAEIEVSSPSAIVVE